jgi:hypothetical protein
MKKMAMFDEKDKHCHLSKGPWAEKMCTPYVTSHFAPHSVLGYMLS